MQKYFLLISSLILLTFSLAQGAVSPIAIDIVPPIQFPPEDFSVAGLRVSVLGQHRNMYGIDIAAIGNMTDLTFTGLALAGGFNATHGTTSIIGLQVAGITNINTNKTNIVGVQAAVGMNSNQATSSIVGVELGAIGNLCPNTSIYGFQIGLYNKALDIYGFQIGLINNVTNLHGLQIGLINFNEKGLFRVVPILNAGF